MWNQIHNTNHISIWKRNSYTSNKTCARSIWVKSQNPNKILVYRFKAVPIKVEASYHMDINKQILKFTWRDRYHSDSLSHSNGELDHLVGRAKEEANSSLVRWWCLLLQKNKVGWAIMTLLLPHSRLTWGLSCSQAVVFNQGWSWPPSVTKSKLFLLAAR